MCKSGADLQIPADEEMVLKNSERITRLTQIGLENFIETPLEWIFGYRLGLLSNPASVDMSFRHARDLIAEKFPGKLTALYSPQHGFFWRKTG
jgi:uncharacterized protein YbbC (DUF1343 family)